MARTAESLPFHSPERIRGAGVSPTDDAWAIAATLYTLLTSSPPFVGMDRGELEQQILRATPAPLSVFGVDDEAIEQVLADAFSPDLGRRLASVTEMHRRLEQLLPDAHTYPALDDEDDEDTGAQHESPSTIERDGGDRLFAPEEVRPTAEVKPAGAPIGEQDETVMRELPAHIIAMAARAAAGSSPPPAPVAGRPPPPVQAPPPRLPDIEGAATRIVGRDGDATRIAPSRPVPPRMPSDVDDDARTGESRGRGAPSSRRQQVLEPPRPRPGFAAPSSGPVSSSPPPLDPDDVHTVMHGAIPMARAMTGGPVPPPPATQPHHPGAPVLSPAPPDRPAPSTDDDDDDGGRTVLRESPLLRPPGGPMPPGGGVSPQWKPAAPPRTASGSFPAPNSSMLRPSPATQISPGGTQRPGPQDVGYGHTLASPQQAGAAQGDVSNLIQETLESMGRSGAFPPPSGPAPSMPAQPMMAGQPLSMPAPMGVGQPMAQPMLGQQPAMQSMHPGLPPHLQPQMVGPQSFAPPLADAQRADTFQGNITGSDEIEMMRRGRGTGRLVLICFVVLVVAAGLTFAVLKYGPAYGIHVPLP